MTLETKTILQPSDFDGRLVLSSDENGKWYVRRLVLVEDDIDTGNRGFWCDKHLGGPFKSALVAARFVSLKGQREP